MDCHFTFLGKKNESLLLLEIHIQPSSVERIWKEERIFLLPKPCAQVVERHKTYTVSENIEHVQRTKFDKNLERHGECGESSRNGS